MKRSQQIENKAVILGALSPCIRCKCLNVNRLKRGVISDRCLRCIDDQVNLAVVTLRDGDIFSLFPDQDSFCFFIGKSLLQLFLRVYGHNTVCLDGNIRLERKCLSATVPYRIHTGRDHGLAGFHSFYGNRLDCRFDRRDRRLV